MITRLINFVQAKTDVVLHPRFAIYIVLLVGLTILLLLSLGIQYVYDAWVGSEIPTGNVGGLPR